MNCQRPLLYAVNIRAITLCLPALLYLAGCITQQRVSYRNDVAPIIKARCVECHTPDEGIGYLKTGLDLTSYETLLKGSVYDPVIRPGDSRRSVLNMLMEGRVDRPIHIPHDTATALEQDDIEILRQWVDQGAENY